MTTAVLPDIDTSILEDVEPACDYYECTQTAQWYAIRKCCSRLDFRCDSHLQYTLSLANEGGLVCSVKASRGCMHKFAAGEIPWKVMEKL